MHVLKLRSFLSRGCALAALLVLACAGPKVRGAAAEDFLVQVWNTDEGLPHSTVTSIAQTPDGYLWAGTLLAGWRGLTGCGL